MITKSVYSGARNEQKGSAHEQHCFRKHLHVGSAILHQCTSQQTSLERAKKTGNSARLVKHVSMADTRSIPRSTSSRKACTSKTGAKFSRGNTAPMRRIHHRPSCKKSANTPPRRKHVSVPVRSGAARKSNTTHTPPQQKNSPCRTLI